MNVISQNEMTDVIMHATKKTGNFFTVHFRKKDGTVRVMNCRGGVKKHLTGGGRAWNPESKGMVFVWDTASKGYRTLNTKTATFAAIDGKEYVTNGYSKY